MKLLQYFRAHFLTLLSLSYISGIIISTRLSIADKTILLLSFFFVLLSILCQKKKLHTIASFFCIPLFLCAGIYHGSVTSSLPPESNHIYNLIEQPTDTVITGRLKSMPTFDGISSKVLIQLHSVRRGAAEEQVPTTGDVLLQMRFSWPEKHKPGDSLAIRATLNRPGQYKTPGSFDYPQFLARKDIWITGFIRSPSLITDIRENSALPAILSAAPEIVRTRIGSFIGDALPEKNIHGLYRAILLGDKSHLPDEIYEGFKASGLAHILAISGLHLSIIAALLFIVIHKLLTLSSYLTIHINTKKAAGLATIPLLVGYSLLAGMNSPVLRACIMSIVVFIGLLTNRVQTVSILIAAAAMLLLILNPQTLFTASFQLSFAAVFSISLFAPMIRLLVEPSDEPQPSTSRVRRFLCTMKRWGSAALLSSSAAVLGTLPIILFYFHRFPLAGPIANLLVEPAVCLWSLPLGILSIPFMHLSPDIAEFLLNLGSVGLLFSCSLTSFIQSIPHNSIWSASPTPFIITLYYLSFILAAWSLKKRSVFRPLAAISLCMTTLLLLVPELYCPPRTGGNELTVSFLDVGQGSATILEFADGRKVLIDGGGSGFSKTSVGESVIAPFLWHKGIQKLDGIIVTHPDSDHYNGLPFVIKHFSPRFLWTSKLITDEPGYKKLMDLCKQTKVIVKTAEQGDLLKYKNSTIICLANTIADEDFPKDTNGGIILHLVHRDFTILFPGDISDDSEQKLVGDGLPLKSDILLAPHHGSATSNSPPFLEAVSPEAVIVSSGASRKNHFPSSRLTDYSRAHLLPLWKTAEHGTVTIIYKNGKSEVSLMEEWQGNRNPLRRNSGNLVPVQGIKGEVDTEEAATPR